MYIAGFKAYLLKISNNVDGFNILHTVHKL